MPVLIAVALAGKVLFDDGDARECRMGRIDPGVEDGDDNAGSRERRRIGATAATPQAAPAAAGAASPGIATGSISFMGIAGAIATTSRSRATAESSFLERSATSTETVGGVRSTPVGLAIGPRKMSRVVD